MNPSCLRLFLSADLVGSTALKASRNYQSLLTRVSDFRRVAESLGTPKTDQATEIRHLRNCISQEDLDWESQVEGFFNNFHASFCGRFDQKEADTIEPWKALGDELLYAIPLKGRSHAREILLRFLRTLRFHDRKFAAAKIDLRLKGAAWVAGFPVRNRVVELPTKPKRDFLGPDIDVGFRLGKCTWAGMCVVSVELAHLLAHEAPAPPGGDEIRLKRVGWSRLKGVWGGRPYPVYYADLPAADVMHAAVVAPWAAGESRFIRAWLSPTESPQGVTTDRVKAQLDDLLVELPATLGVVRPYCPPEDPVPPDHARILALITSLEQKPIGDGGQQRADQQTGESPETFSQFIIDLIDKDSYLQRLDPPSKPKK